nr:leucine--tRNA ligase, cytoplasmic [Ipomoea batatas]
MAQEKSQLCIVNRGKARNKSSKVPSSSLCGSSSEAPLSFHPKPPFHLSIFSCGTCSVFSYAKRRVGRVFARKGSVVGNRVAGSEVGGEEGDVFRAEPKDSRPLPGEKFFGNFPFPYMNGYLHLGHAFSLSKLEFAAAYHRLRGENVLLPFGFHCTGMPIKASADKLSNEIEMFGNPPQFPVAGEEETGEQEVKAEGEGEGNQTAPGGKFKGKKSKAVAKTGAAKFQWEIMRSYGLSDEEIAKFTNPYHWLTFFPPLAVEDLKAFGLGCDWRRSFITTDMNPYFDSFVRWQVRKLKSLGKIVKDLRFAIYSPKDGQPCADHDRASGEGVIPQEYTLIKMEVVAPFPSKMGVLEGRKVYPCCCYIKARGQCMDKQNAWVLPDGKAARNLALPEGCPANPRSQLVWVELTGQDLIGLPLRSPLAFNEVIYTLPMLSVLTEKGTGIVTSVPSGLS